MSSGRKKTNEIQTLATSPVYLNRPADFGRTLLMLGTFFLELVNRSAVIEELSCLLSSDGGRGHRQKVQPYYHSASRTHVQRH
jgi:hypothetical protein